VPPARGTGASSTHRPIAGMPPAASRWAWVIRTASTRPSRWDCASKSRVTSSSTFAVASTSSELSSRWLRPVPGVPPLAPVPRNTRRARSDGVGTARDCGSRTALTAVRDQSP
jgi:hypothetical protein